MRVARSQLAAHLPRALFWILLILSTGAQAQTITSIADIQADPGTFDGQVVTVEGQVYIPTDYRVTVVSGYIQGSSGRGINLFSSTTGVGADDPLLKDTGNIVRVTGTVDQFFTTVEILDITNVTLISSGNPPLTPTVLTTGAAASSAWEGTFIETSGTISAKAVGGPGLNYTVNDGSGPIVIRVVDVLGATEFNVGQTITGRGAGGQFGSDFQVNVGSASDVFEGGTGDTTPPTLVSAGAVGGVRVDVEFSEPVSSATAETPGNYELFETAMPGNTISISSATLLGSDTVALGLGSALQNGVNYTVRVNNVQDVPGNTIVANSTIAFLYTALPITSIATIQADPESFEDQVVTVEGQVYCPGNYQADGSSVSAYIQDGSNRGMNIFGTFSSTGFADLNSTGNIVRVTGTVTLFFTTVELTGYNVELLSTGNPPLSPAVQASTAAAALPSNEGTYIQASGVITAIETTGGTNPARNFTVTDCSGPLEIRVDDDLAIGTPVVGDSITASGAGGTFSGQGLITVCSAAEFTNHGFVGDSCPPVLVSATLTGASEVTASFDESIDPTTGNTAGNYEVFETATPANTITVNSAVVSSASVVLTLASPVSIGVDYTLRVNNVEDLNGNAVAPNSSVSIFDPIPQEIIVITEIMQNPDVLPDATGEWFEIRNDGTAAVDMDGWTIKDNDSDIHVINNGGPLMIPAGAYRVLGISAADMAGEGVPLFYQYSDVFLGNSADELVLVNTSMQEVDRVEWDGGLTWPDPVGSSMQWDGSGDSNDGGNWFGFGNAPQFGGGDRGTPGAANDVSTSAQPPAMVNGLDANYPNPFNPRTTFSFTLEESGRVTLSIYNVRGLKVRTLLDKELQRGAYKDIVWDGRNDRGRPVTSGTYFYRLETASGFSASKKLTVLK